MSAKVPDGYWVEWTSLNSDFTLTMDYRHICAYDGPVKGCPDCKEDTSAGDTP